jgi:hypothetical protein
LVKFAPALIAIEEVARLLTWRHIELERIRA